MTEQLVSAVLSLFLSAVSFKISFNTPLPCLCFRLLHCLFFLCIALIKMHPHLKKEYQNLSQAVLFYETI